MQSAKVATIEWLRNGLALVGLVAVGYWLAAGGTVRAAGSDTEFQLSGVSEGSSLLVYQPASKSVYVYRGATEGSSNVQCSFKFVLDQPGKAIQRVNCPVGSAF